MSIIDAAYDTINSTIHGTCSKVHLRFRTYVERDDLMQECWEWCWRRKDKVREYLERDDDVDRKRGEWALRTALIRLATRYARKEKAAASGYELSDEYYYSIEQIKDLLAYYFAGDWSARLRVDDSDERYTKTLDPAEGNNVLAMMSDIDRAYAMLTDDERILLGLLFKEPTHTHRGIAKMLGEGVPHITVQRKEQRALDKMQHYLGGDSPWH